MNTINTLHQVQADTYLLAVKTQNFHWNYTGKWFPGYHALFEEQYDELSEAVDEVAERARQLGSPALGSMKEFLEHATLEESSMKANPEEMVAMLAKDHRSISTTLKGFVKSEALDPATEDMFIARMQAHDKAAWMLEATA